MINQDENHVAWVLLCDELTEAREHLVNLETEFAKSDEFDESEFRVQLGHVYAHLNRAWNARSQSNGVTDENWDEMSQFPTDIEPIG